MTIEESRQRSPATPVSGRDAQLARMARIVSTGARAASDAASMVVRRAPRTMRATRTGARDVTSALQTLPDPTLRSLAATSLGLGAGFYVAGARRLAVAAGLAPAIVLGAALVLRPIRRPIAREANG